MAQLATEKKTIGYIRSIKQADHDCDYQAMLIRRYAQINGLGDPEMVVDRRLLPRRNQMDIERAVKLGMIPKKNTGFFRAWEEMLLEAQAGRIGTIIVDRRERLYRVISDKTLLERIVTEHTIRILEVENIDWPDENRPVNVAVYHFFVPSTRGSEMRSMPLLNDLGDFYEEAAAHENWKIIGLYIDSWAYRRVEFPKLMQRTDVKVIICKFFYHMNRKVLAFLQIVRELNEKGTSLVSTEEGEIHYHPACKSKAPFYRKKLKVAAYNCFGSDYEMQTGSITRRKFELFCKFLTTKSVKMDYFEEDLNTRSLGSEFERLTKRARRYDLILIDSFTRLGESVNELMKCLQRVGIPVCSLKEGLLYLDGKDKNVQSGIIQQGVNNS